MRISFPQLIEDGESSYSDTGEHAIHGLICDQVRTIARYSVLWPQHQPTERLIFDIVFGQLRELKPGEVCNAVSLSHDGTGSYSFLNAASRPFAKMRARLCSFPQNLGGEDDISINSFDTVSFILRNDSRIPEFFQERA